MASGNWTRAAFGNRAALARQRRQADGAVQRIVEVDDPAEPKASKPAVKVMRPRGIEDMHARGRLSDRHYAAAKRFEALYERASAGSVASVDYGAVRVDGGRAVSVGTLDDTMGATDALRAIERRVGPLSYRVLALMAGHGMGVGEARTMVPANDNGNAVSRNRLHEMLTEALDALDVYWSDPGAKPRGIRSG